MGGDVRSSICLIKIPGDDRKDGKETLLEQIIAEAFQECFLSPIFIPMMHLCLESEALSEGRGSYLRTRFDTLILVCRGLFPLRRLLSP